MISYNIAEINGYANNTSKYYVTIYRNGVKKSVFEGSGESGKPSIMYSAIKAVWKRLK